MLKKTDYVYSFFLSPGGFTAWVIRRGGHIMICQIMEAVNFYQSIVGCGYDEGAEKIADGAMSVYRMFGAREFPVFGEVADCTEDLMILNEQFAIRDATIKQAMEAARKQKLNPDGTEAAVPSNVVPINQDITVPEG